MSNTQQMNDEASKKAAEDADAKLKAAEAKLKAAEEKAAEAEKKAAEADRKVKAAEARAKSAEGKASAAEERAQAAASAPPPSQDEDGEPQVSVKARRTLAARTQREEIVEKRRAEKEASGVLVRLRPYNKAASQLRESYTLSLTGTRSIQFVAAKGWYRVSEEQAAKLAEVRGSDNPLAPHAFDIAFNSDEAQAIVDKERLAGQGDPYRPIVVRGGEGDDGRNARGLRSAHDGDTERDMQLTRLQNMRGRKRDLPPNAGEPRTPDDEHDSDDPIDVNSRR